MKKRVLFFVALFLAGCLCWAVLSNLSASDEVRPASTRPTPYSMKVENLSPGKGIFTEYYFAPNGDQELPVAVTLQAADTSSCKAKILLFQIGIDENIDSFTTEDFSGNIQISHIFTGLDPNAYYYLRIENVSSFLFKASHLNGAISVG